jgi:hypothetical protein
MAEVQYCCTCRWGWHFEDVSKEPHDSFGECHRHAPHPVAYNDNITHYKTLWPVVHGESGCGDWMTRKLD